VRPRLSLRVPASRQHLFYFRKMVVKPETFIEAGAVVDVVDRNGAFAGVGFYNPKSEIAIRLLSVAEAPGDDLLERRLRDAVALRHDLLKLRDATDAYRVCHAEGDGLTGLVIDRFAGVVVAQLYSLGWFRRIGDIRRVIGELFPGAAVHVTTDDQAARLEGFTLPAAPVPPGVVITEHGAKYRVDFATGHKTGFFCDQRENRRAVAALAPGRTMLDLCCYTGGFALQAALAGAKRVVGVDLDEEALDTARGNARLNKTKIDFLHADIFNYLRQLREKADLVVLDPAKLARTREDVVKARRSYRDMNALAMRALTPGGILVSCSCSGLVSEPDFLDILRDAARVDGRELRVLRVAGAGPDHPVSSLFPEGRYLKVVTSVVA
jgi:23S rRNA (cytosine1962-C5)-methyltransferase